MMRMTDVAPEPLAFSAHDRCDRCGAQAYVETQHEGGILLWCAHHADEYQTLAPTMRVNRDSRALLWPK